MKIIEEQDTRNIYISLNYHCNNKCIMCGVPFRKHGMYNESIDFYIEQLKKVPFEIKENDIITISGGEPFLFAEIFEFIAYIRNNYKCRITIFTNGRKLKNMNYVKKIQEYKIEKLVIPYFSYKEETHDIIAGVKGAYKDWIEALRNLETTSLYYELKFLPMKQNYQHILDSYIFCKQNYPNAKFTVCGVQYFGQAVENVSLMGIRYSDVKVWLEKTVDYALATYDEFIPIYRFPMCILDAKYNNNGILTLFKEYIIGPDYSDVDRNEDEMRTIKMPSICDECVGFCDWYSKKYEKIYGFDELKTLKINL